MFPTEAMSLTPLVEKDPCRAERPRSHELRYPKRYPCDHGKSPRILRRATCDEFWDTVLSVGRYDHEFLSPPTFQDTGVSNGMHEELAETASAFHADAYWQRPFLHSADVTEASNRDPTNGRFMITSENG
jgi:hypothetical protein